MNFLQTRKDNQKKDAIPLTDITGPKLAEQLIKFGELQDYLPDDLVNRLLSIDLKNFISSTPGLKAHKSCYDKYNNSKYDRAVHSRSKRSSADSTQELGPPRTRQKSGTDKHVCFGEEKCMFCDEADTFDEKHGRHVSNKLHAAAGKQSSGTYVDDFTRDLRKMAAALRDTNLLVKLNTRDVRALELYYHLKCYTAYVRRLAYFFFFFTSIANFIAGTKNSIYIII